VTASIGYILTAAQSGAIVIWTGGVLSLPSAPAVGTYYEIYNLTGADATVGFSGSDGAHSTQGGAAILFKYTLKWAYVGSNDWVWSR